MKNEDKWILIQAVIVALVVGGFMWAVIRAVDYQTTKGCEADPIPLEQREFCDKFLGN